jgi:pimeloyl-ACP methyl ester carboxylesterase
VGDVEMSDGEATTGGDAGPGEAEAAAAAAEVAAWAARSRTVTVGGEAIAVVDVPAAGDVAAGRPDRGAPVPPLLVVHGFPTSSIDFAPIVDRLAERRRVVLLDLPGYGLSAKPDRAYSLFGQADVVEAVVADAGLADVEVDLLTHDMGDSVGGELLARTLDGTGRLRVRRRVLTNGSIYLDLARLTDGQKVLRAMPDEMLERGLDAPDLTATLAALCVPEPAPGSDARRLLRAAAELVGRDGSRLLPRLIRYLDERARHESRWTGAVEAHPAPLTVVWGRHDPIAVAPMIHRLAERRPDAAVTWLDAGHWPMVEQPEAFAGAVLAALDAP